LGVVYAWLFVTFQGVVSPAQLAAHTTDALPYLATALVGSGWARLMVLAVVLSVVATSQTTLVSLSRVSYSMGSDRLLPGPFARIHPRFSTPAWAAMFWGAVMVLIAVGYAASASLASAFGDVINLEAVPFTFFFIFTALATTWYYRRLLRRSVLDAILVGVCPLAAAGVLAWVLEQSVISLAPPTPWILLGLTVAGFVLMVISRVVLKAPFFWARHSAWTPGVDDPPRRAG
jgi:amino acid transporter